MNRLALCAMLLFFVGSAAGAAEEDLRDPTRPLSYSPVATTSGSPDFALQAIFQRSSGREAIINGQNVGVGDSVAGARIEAISTNSVVYSYQGQRHTLRLHPQIRK